MSTILKIGVAASLCAISYGLQAQKCKRVVTYHDALQKKPAIVAYVLADKPKVYHGIFQEYYSSGIQKTQGQYKIGEADGLWTQYYESGQIKTYGGYKEGKPFGAWTQYYESGRPLSQGVLNGNKKQGLWRFFFQNGNLRAVGVYRDNIQDSIWNYFFEDGKLKAQTTFEKGYGYYKEFFQTGKVRMEGKMKDGKSTGVWKYYFETGQLKAEGIEEEGVKNGYWKFFNDGGKIESEGGFKNGLQTGNWKYYHSNGSLSQEGEVSEGKKEGNWKLYHETGQFMGSSSFKEGKGEYIELYENGKVKVKGKIEDGNFVGEWLHYREDGSLEGRSVYDENGEGSYQGYYPDGTIRLKGKLKNGVKKGAWELYDNDGSLKAIMKSYQELEAVPNAKVEVPKDTIAKRQGFSSRVIIDKVDDSYLFYKPRADEIRGIALTINPFGLLANQVSAGLEYHIFNRLGFEFQYFYLRDPLFDNHSSMLTNKVYSNGFAIAVKQKLYLPDRGRGNRYFAQEIRQTRMEHITMGQNIGSTDPPIRVEANETRTEISGMLGIRVHHKMNEKAKLYADLHVGFGLGVRSDNGLAKINQFNSVPLRPLTFPLRAGFNFGILFH